MVALTWPKNMPSRYDPTKHHRHSIRLRGYDYALSGAYFITIVSKNRECILGEIVNGEMHLNDFGSIVQSCWDDLPRHYPHVMLDAFAVMPNHAHGIVVLHGDGFVGAGLRPAPTAATIAKRHPLPEIVRAFKSFAARRINELCDTTGTSVWQRNYYEHIVRDEDELNRIRYYIETNPVRWELDRENLSRRDLTDDWSKDESRWFAIKNLVGRLKSGHV